MPPLLLYDGVCGLCNRTVQFVIRHDTEGDLLFAPLQSDVAAEILQRHPELRGVDSVLFVDRDGGGERVRVRSAAALRIAGYLGGAWRLALVGWVIPRFLRDALYDLIARSRYRLFGRYDACMLPPPETRHRFIGTIPAEEEN